MELTWPMKIRIAAAMVVGAALLGFAGGSLTTPQQPATAALLTGLLSPASAAICFALAFAAGFIAYFAAWPYGRQVGILAAPAGLALWAVRSADMSTLLRLNNTLSQRTAVYSSLMPEAFFWLAIVAAGFFGVLLAKKISWQKTQPYNLDDRNLAKDYATMLAALTLSALIAKFCIGLFAQDVKIFDARLGSVTGQPSTAQIAFAVIVSFAAAAFVVKKFLNANYIWPALATALVAVWSMYIAGRPDLLKHLSANWPISFFTQPAAAILPIQIVTFGVFGSVAGYWLAVQYIYWRKHCS